ncbi:MAG: peptidoglycan DD-metalloendopeptidase family protein [Parahaliea sp.]
MLTRHLPGSFSLLLVLCVPILALPACGSNPAAPVEDLNRTAQASKPQVFQSGNPLPAAGTAQYRVQAGDTLYSIAWRQGFDFRRLAAANNIPAPYTIYPGQLLQLRESALPAAEAGSASEQGKPGAARSAQSRVSQRSAEPVVQPAKQSDTKVTTEPVIKSSSSSLKKQTKAGDSQSRPTLPSKPPAHWLWPAKGRVVRGFSATVHKGIDIAGNRGDAVQAVADGIVVYAGAGIVGFGELLIVKHDDTHLSAYGHNERLLVREGSAVKAGQIIAEKGSSGTDTVKLHFEIRRAGKPVDPLILLPRR